jgi:hypothetical protein
MYEAKGMVKLRQRNRPDDLEDGTSYSAHTPRLPQSIRNLIRRSGTCDASSERHEEDRGRDQAFQA